MKSDDDFDPTTRGVQRNMPETRPDVWPPLPVQQADDLPDAPSSDAHEAMLRAVSERYGPGYYGYHPLVAVLVKHCETYRRLYEDARDTLEDIRERGKDI